MQNFKESLSAATQGCGGGFEEVRSGTQGVPRKKSEGRRLIPLMMEQERFAREVEINSTVFIELKKQLEIAKIEEIKNIPLINVLDPARPPAKKSFSNRALS
jgi:uncharacterized protein involved in exopolysaccharide biosynthesis